MNTPSLFLRARFVGHRSFFWSTRWLVACMTTCLATCLVGSMLVPADAQAETIYRYTNSQGDTVFTDQPTKGAKRVHVDPPPTIPLTPIDLPPLTVPAPKAPPAEVRPQTSPGAPLVPSVLMHAPLSPPALHPESHPPAMSPPAAPKAPAQPVLSPRTPMPVTAIPKANPAPPARFNSAAHRHYQSLHITEPQPGSVTAHAGGTIFVQVDLKPVLDVTVGDRIRIVIDGEDQVEDSTGHRFMISGLSNGQHTIIAFVSREGKNIFQSTPVVIHLTGAPDGKQP